MESLLTSSMFPIFTKFVETCALYSAVSMRRDGWVKRIGGKKISGKFRRFSKRLSTRFRSAPNLTLRFLHYPEVPWIPHGGNLLTSKFLKYRCIDVLTCKCVCVTTRRRPRYVNLPPVKRVVETSRRPIRFDFVCTRWVGS